MGSPNSIKWRVQLLAYAPALFWLGVIFYLSSGSGASTETSRIIGPLIAFFFPSADETTIQLVHAAIRKTAHVTEYAILAALAARAFLSSDVPWLQNKWAVWAMALVAVTASLDEFNQSFNSMRSGSPFDTLLDISGGLLAVILVWLFLNWRKRKQNPAVTMTAGK